MRQYLRPETWGLQRLDWVPGVARGDRGMTQRSRHGTGIWLSKRPRVGEKKRCWDQMRTQEKVNRDECCCPGEGGLCQHWLCGGERWLAEWRELQWGRDRTSVCMYCTHYFHCHSCRRTKPTLNLTANCSCGPWELSMVCKTHPRWWVNA